jgi:hypothetical protein
VGNHAHFEQIFALKTSRSRLISGDFLENEAAFWGRIPKLNHYKSLKISR